MMTVKMIESIASAQLEKPIRIIFSNKEVMEFTPKQYSELLALIMNDLCKDCRK
jgi:hypothetical protein